MALQHLRSSTADKRPTPAAMSDGQLALNTNLASPGLFFKDSNGDSVKIGPVHVGTTAPNVTPGAGGQAGNSKGEAWLDTSAANPILKVFNGSAFVAVQPVGTGTVVSTTDTGTVTSTMILDGTILNADVNASAAIVDTKLATIATGGKVSGTAITSGNISTSGSFTSTSTVTGTNLIPTGSGVPTNGIYLPAANSVAVATNGTRRLLIDSAGALTLDTGDATSYGVRVGRGASAISTNTVVGNDALTAITTGGLNTAMGGNALKGNTDGVQNTAVGYNALIANTSGNYNTAYGLNALFGNTTGSYNKCIGNPAGIALTTGSNNTIIGCVGGTAGLANTVIIGAGATERLRIDSGGVTSITAGIKFPATQVASADPNTLDDYEEGTFTPTIIQGFTSITYTTQLGNYSKVGKLVYFNIRIVTSSATTNGNQTQLGVLPFTPATTSFAATFYGPSAITTGIGQVQTNSRINLYQNASTLNTANVNGSNFSSGAVNIFVTGCYEV